MTEALGRGVAVVIHGTILLLGAIIPSQFQQSLHVRGFAVRGDLCISQEVQIKLGIRVLDCANQGHTHRLLVEFETGLGILDTQHGVVHAVGARVGGGGQILLGPLNDLDPVSIGILRKGDVSHATLGQLLLKRISGILDPLASDFNVVDGDGEMAEASVWLGVAVDDTVLGVVLGTPIVAEFDGTLEIGKVAISIQRLRAGIGQEVVCELSFRDIHLDDHAHTEELVELQRSLGVLDPQHRVYISWRLVI